MGCRQLSALERYPFCLLGNPTDQPLFTGQHPCVLGSHMASVKIFLFFLCFGLWLSLGAVLLDAGCCRGCEHDVMASRGSQLFCSCVCLGCRQPPCALWLEANQGHTEDGGSSPSSYTFGSVLDLGRQAHSVSPQAQLDVSVKNIGETPKQACRPG